MFWSFSSSGSDIKLNVTSLLWGSVNERKHLFAQTRVAQKYSAVEMDHFFAVQLVGRWSGKKQNPSCVGSQAFLCVRNVCLCRDQYCSTAELRRPALSGCISASASLSSVSHLNQLLIAAPMPRAVPTPSPPPCGWQPVIFPCATSTARQPVSVI